MNWSNFIAGLAILGDHFDDKDGYHIAAEHDQFYVYQTSRPLSPANVEKMDELGWFQPDHEDDDPYDPENGWSCFT